jgi:hypothetical protein
MRLKKAITILVSVFVFVATMEVCARIDDKIRYDAPFFSLYSSDLLRSIDDEGININVPNNQFEKWKINQLGFRGPDIPLIKPKGMVRIICVGTSETFGLYEDPGKEWTTQFKDLLEEFRRFQVINVSVVSLPLKKYHRYIEKYVLELKPDIIILFINPFRYGVGVNKFTERQTLPRKEVNKSERGWKISLSGGTPTLRILPKFVHVVHKRVPEKVMKLYRILKMKKQLRKLENARLNGNKPLDMVSKESLDTFRTDLEELIQFLSHQKIEVIMSSYPVLISTKNIQDHLDIFLWFRSFYIELSLLGIIDASLKFNNVIKEVSIKHGITFIDNNAAIPKNTRYFIDNVHYTNEGARFIASSFANYIKRRFSLSP